jgi:hypothetical protein
MPGPRPEHPHLRLLKGNPGKRRVRIPPEPARADECPPPPEHLTGYAREAWLHLAPELHRLNLFTVLDVGPFSAYCCALCSLATGRGGATALGRVDDQDRRRPSPSQPAGEDRVATPVPRKTIQDEQANISRVPNRAVMERETRRRAGR